MPRYAILSDVHGNPLALEAVLTTLAADGPFDGYWLLGDYAAIGFDPATAVSHVMALPNLLAIRGNTDRMILEAPADEDSGWGWAQRQLAAAGSLNWLASLPLEVRQTLPNGTRVLLVHASPGTDDGPGLHLGQNAATRHALFGHADADLVLVGHTHWAQDVPVGAIRVFNPGSVSNGLARDLRAKYAILSADATGYTLEQRFLPYDLAASIAAAEASDSPSRSQMLKFFRGQILPDWLA